ncbi:MAG: hypothetical protein JKX79_10755 [Labilibaculum sp.]|nr:hypothetical protein [Labilibaculum sp.]
MNKISLSLFFLILVPSFLLGQETDIKRYLNKLDEYIAKQSVFENKKNERVSLLKNKLSRGDLTLEEEYGINMLLYEEYSTHKYDLMYIYSQRLYKLATKLNKKDLIVKSLLARVNTFLWGGFFKEASEYLQQIDTTDTKQQIQIQYLSLHFDIAFESGLYAKYPKTVFFDIYKSQMKSVIGQLERFLPPDDILLLDKKVKQAYYNDENEIAIEYGLLELDCIKDKKSVAFSNLVGGIGYNYVSAGDTLKGIKYMVDAAIGDIERGSKQFSSLRMIAEVVYAAGYLERAYEYIQLAMNNAKFFGSRYRIYEASNILPEVGNELYKLTRKQNDKITNLLLIISVFSLVLLLSVVIILKQNRKLHKIRMQLNKQNDELIETNGKIKGIIKELSESNNIKEVSVGQLFNSNLEFHNKLVNFQKTIQRKIKFRQYDDLHDFVNSSELFQKREEILSSFDNMFLRLFPNFIGLFNSLLKPTDRIEPQRKGALSPELRIFALIRLGIARNESIAKILDYSISTVKNYKTKIKNSSVISNKEFEKKIMEIESVENV